MRFNPSRCPECNELAFGTQETVPGTALLDFDADGEAEYSGETKMHWDGQTTDTTDDGQVLLWCQNGHSWPADMEG